MRRLKLGQLLDTLPERLALAGSNRLPHHDFLQMLLADEVTRRDRQSAARRAKAAQLNAPDHGTYWGEKNIPSAGIIPLFSARSIISKM